MRISNKYKTVFAKEIIIYFKALCFSLILSLCLISTNYLIYYYNHKQYLIEKEKLEIEYNNLVKERKEKEDIQWSIIIKEYESTGKPAAKKRIKKINERLKKDLALSEKLKLKNELACLNTYLEYGPTKNNLVLHEITEEFEKYNLYHKSYEVFLGDKKNIFNTQISLGKYLIFTLYSFLTILCLRFTVLISKCVQWIIKTSKLDL